VNKKEKNQLIGEFNSANGSWIYDIHLEEGVWTNGEAGVPHTRLRRILQIAHDLSGKALNNCRVLDLGCLEGMFSFEFASHGSETIGIEIREENYKKACFLKSLVDLPQLSFIQMDARDISKEKLGLFDIVICSGLLYHLTAEDAADLLKKMFDMSTKLVIVDTHISFLPEKKAEIGESVYFGRLFGEHNSEDSQDLKNKRRLASWDNETSFWFTRPSMVNLLQNVGFSSVFECFSPTHLNFGKEGVENTDRCTFVALKSESISVKSSPGASKLSELWPEGSLNYYSKPAPRPTFFRPFKMLFSFFRRFLG
jgi:2-polyprenyl-3-methyl-5-hydroxy-6-metoxy-1,4-benzoquinol methylase